VIVSYTGRQALSFYRRGHFINKREWVYRYAVFTQSLNLALNLNKVKRLFMKAKVFALKDKGKKTSKNINILTGFYFYIQIINYKFLSKNSFNCVFDNAPTLVSIISPPLNNNKVGIPRTPYFGGVAGF